MLTTLVMNLTENKQTTKNCWLLTYQKQKKMVSKLVIAGEPMGIQSLFCTPTLFLEFALDPGAQLHHDVPESWKVFAYVIESRSIFRVLWTLPMFQHWTVVVFGQCNDGVSVWKEIEVCYYSWRTGGSVPFSMTSKWIILT